MKKLFKISKGFTLIELLVTVGIFVMITGLLMAKYNNFNNGILLTNLAYDVALTIRTAQAYGLNVQSKPTANLNYSDEYLGIYGVHFDTNSTSFVMFADLSNNNGIYDSSQNEQISTTNIRGGSRISYLCAGNTANCVAGESLDMTFKRPEPVAKITVTPVGGGTPVSNNSYAEIHVSSRDGVTKIITISSIGQIAVK